MSPKSCDGVWSSVPVQPPSLLNWGLPQTHWDLHPPEFLDATNPGQGPGWGCGVVVILVGGIPVKKVGCLSSPARATMPSWQWDEMGLISGDTVFRMFLSSLGFSVCFTSCFTFFSSS